MTALVEKRSDVPTGWITLPQYHQKLTEVSGEWKLKPHSMQAYYKHAKGLFGDDIHIIKSGRAPRIHLHPSALNNLKETHERLKCLMAGAPTHMPVRWIPLSQYYTRLMEVSREQKFTPYSQSTYYTHRKELFGVDIQTKGRGRKSVILLHPSVLGNFKETHDRLTGFLKLKFKGSSSRFDTLEKLLEHVGDIETQLNLNRIAKMNTARPQSSEAEARSKESGMNPEVLTDLVSEYMPLLIRIARGDHVFGLDGKRIYIGKQLTSEEKRDIMLGCLANILSSSDPEKLNPTYVTIGLGNAVMNELQKRRRRENRFSSLESQIEKNGPGKIPIARKEEDTGLIGRVNDILFEYHAKSRRTSHYPIWWLLHFRGVKQQEIATNYNVSRNAVSLGIIKINSVLQKKLKEK